MSWSFAWVSLSACRNIHDTLPEVGLFPTAAFRQRETQQHTSNGIWNVIERLEASLKHRLGITSIEEVGNGL